MFDRLKNLFRRRLEEEPVSEPLETAYPPREFQTGYTPGGHSAPPPEAPEPPAETLPEPVAAAPSRPGPATGDSIRILLKSVLLKLPDALKSKVRQPPAGAVYISIPLQKVLAQLPQGSVKISYGELRLAAPAGVFLDISTQDQTPVELPLPEIVAQLKPDQLPRRTTQRTVEVPEEVSGIFGPKGEPLTAVRMSTAPAKAPSPAAPAIAPKYIPTSGPAMPATQPSVPLRPSAPLPPPPIKPTSPLPAPSALRSPLAPTQAQPAAPAIRPSQPLPTTSPPKPAAGPPAAPLPQPPAAPTGPLAVPLAQISGGWPDAIKQTLAEPSNATISFPADELEQALKRGKILFAWKRLRLMINPPPLPSAAPGLDDTQLELPLPVIAPLFLAHKKPAGPQKRYTITEHIPDVFTGKGLAPSPQAQVTPPVTPAAAPAAPTLAPSIAMPAAPPPRAPAPPAPALSAEVPQEIGEVFGQPGRKNWTPSEIVQKTGALRGVAGALIAMQDGLLVAANLPPGLNGETIAAFLPQMFSRMLQYSKELKFGEANNLTIIVDEVPLKIFKAGGVFFTVLGRAGESLPEPHLGIVAAQLGPQNK
ncbi:MAG TPA: roadblock/LC7 domain-containing protein [Candidatus Angelobacter sp.]|nr:roadblock/LC7 domain-containing protein [Candidatus Angelobacter sp.]